MYPFCLINIGGEIMNIEKYTQNAQSAIIDCQNIAIEEGHQQIDGEHLHLALLMQKDGLIPKVHGCKYRRSHRSGAGRDR